MSIADLKGIEYFTALNELNCSNNKLTALDLSANTALETLHCNNNQLTALDVSKNMALEELLCYDNKLTALDVSKNTALTILYCYGNQIRGKGMQTLINSLHSTGGYLCVYTSAATDGNEINTIQVGEAKAKKWTVTEKNGSSEVDYAGIHAVAIDETNFPDYNFRENWILKQTFADDNYLNDKEAASVTAIDVSSKGIADLTGIEHFTALKTLNCSGNYLETSTLDLSKNKALEVLDCSINRLNALDVSKNTALKELYCYRNSIRDEGMQTLISSLHQNGGTLYAYDTTYDQNEMTTANVADAKAKKWQVKAWDGSKYVDYAGIFAVYINNTNFPDATFRNYVGDFDQNTNGYLTEDEINVVTDISVPLMDITSLKGIEHFTELITLDCNSNKLTALDVTKNTALKNLICTGNQLSDINLSKNTALEGLDCSYNKLTALNVSTNTALTTLSCENNQLTALDVTNNIALEYLYCYGNQISKGMQALISSLRQNGGVFYGYSSENDDNKITTEQVAAAMKKGWSVFMWDGSDWVPFNGTVLGDANGDENVDVADIVAIVSHQKGQDVEGFSLPAADVNDDGKADGKDIELISKIIMKE
jgi:Leucine-rich repeat (LRR) protein